MTTSAPTRGRPPGSTGPKLLAEARAVFLDRGYAATTMDDVAARARISKSSLYREHPSKSALYAAVVSDWAASGRDAMRPSLERLEQDPDVERGLTELAEVLLGAILSPPVVEMRRLVINEAKTQPQVAATYLQESWNRNIAGLADTFDRLRERGRLNVEDTRAAAEDFTWLLVGGPLNAALLGVEPHPEADRPAQVVALFLARYGIRN
jgi:TetR/AcrR family transcriptional regulator, mexJK operon transcriptional repressor